MRMRPGLMLHRRLPKGDKMLCKNNYRKTCRRFIRAVLLVLALIALNLAGGWANVPVGLAAPPLIWTVTNTSDSGAGSLRDAINSANLNGIAVTIRFRIRPGGAQTIQVGSGGNGALPATGVPVVIDGTTQSGCAGHPCIILDGTSAGAGANGLQISGGSSTVRGLVIVNFGDSGINLNTAGGNHVEGNFIGMDASGKTSLGNGFAGIDIWNSPNNVIGGTTPAARNLLSGNQAYGVHLGGQGSTGNVVEGNYIGTDNSGTISRPNYDGVEIEAGASNNTIGGTTAVACNLISGNAFGGVFIEDSSTTGNVVVGNYVGTDVTGRLALGNTIGVYIERGASNNTVGGTKASARNIISGNVGEGVYIQSSITTGNVIEGNYIGTTRNGNGALGNGAAGVDVVANDNTIGGMAKAAGNRIAFNHAGILVGSDAADPSKGNAVRGNSIFSNIMLGIDLGADGVTLDDAGDGDAGPNNLQNFPVLTSARSGSSTIQGNLNSTPNSTFTLELFSNPHCNPSGYGEGKTFLGSKQVTTDGTGSVSFAVNTTRAFAKGSAITATATDSAGNTSEFSICKTAR
jgi:hypothetical protein